MFIFCFQPKIKTESICNISTEVRFCDILNKHDTQVYVKFFHSNMLLRPFVPKLFFLMNALSIKSLHVSTLQQYEKPPKGAVNLHDLYLQTICRTL